MPESKAMSPSTFTGEHQGPWAAGSSERANGKLPRYLLEDFAGPPDGCWRLRAGTCAPSRTSTALITRGEENQHSGWQCADLDSMVPVIQSLNSVADVCALMVIDAGPLGICYTTKVKQQTCNSPTSIYKANQVVVCAQL